MRAWFQRKDFRGGNAIFPVISDCGSLPSLLERREGVTIIHSYSAAEKDLRSPEKFAQRRHHTKCLGHCTERECIMA